MSDPQVALACVALLFLLVLSGFSIPFALAIIGLVGSYLITDSFQITLALAGSTTFESIRQYIFAVVPLFVVMGSFMVRSGAGASLFAAANAVLRRLPGGLGISTVFSNAVFAAVTGVSVASAAIFSKVAYPQMVRFGYNSRIALGTVAGSSVLGMLIPPSLLLVLYGVITQVSIGQLFIGGILPGIVLSLLFSATILLWAVVKPQLFGARRGSAVSVGAGPAAEEVTGRPLWRSLLDAIPVVVLIVLVIGGIWTGLFTPTEASAVGAIGALIVGFAMRMSGRDFLASLFEAAVSTGMIMFLLIAAQLYSRMLTQSGAVETVGDSLAAVTTSAIGTVVIIIAVLLVLGMVLDSSSIILLTLPFVFPMLIDRQIDPLWFGVVMVVAVEVGMLTPPFGMVPFAMSGVLGSAVKVQDIFMGAAPFIVSMLALLVLLLVFPGLVTWLPLLSASG